MDLVVRLIAIMFAVFGGVMFGTQLGQMRGRESERREAIKAGVAEYIVNKTTGDTAFTYKKLPEK